MRIDGPLGLNCSPFISPMTTWVWYRLQDSGRTYSIERAVPLNNLRSFFFFLNMCVGLGKSQKNKDKNKHCIKKWNGFQGEKCDPFKVSPLSNHDPS